MTLKKDIQHNNYVKCHILIIVILILKLDVSIFKNKTNKILNKIFNKKVKQKILIQKLLVV